jgi:heat shock protein HslJ
LPRDIIDAAADFTGITKDADMIQSVRRLAFFVLLAPITASWADEPSLICFGNEPFWRLDLTEAGKARFSTPDSPAVDYVGAANALVWRKESVWRGQATVPDGGELVALLRAGACSDGMSDAVHPYSVNVSLPDGRHYAGCCRIPDVPVAAATLQDSTWRLTQLPGRTLPAVHERNAVTVSFKGGRVHGFSGCNQFMGSYTLEGERLVLGRLGGTMMACPEPAMSLESHFLKSFSGALSVAVAGNTMTLKPASGGDALQFELAPPPRLEAVRWEVTGYNNGRQAVVGTKTGTRLTLMFQGGKVSGSSGCNRFHGPFRVEGSALKIGPLATTRKACDDAVMTQEREFLRALESATTWDIVRGMLDVHRADGERVLTANPMGG